MKIEKNSTIVIVFAVSSPPEPKRQTSGWAALPRPGISDERESHANGILSVFLEYLTTFDLECRLSIAVQTGV